MPYYIRVLGTSDSDIHLDDLVAKLENKSLSLVFSLLDDETPASWTWLQVSNREQNRELVLIERNPVVEGELGAEELEEFKEIVLNYQPASAAAWLVNYFSYVKVIYAFQILQAVESEADWELVSAVKTAIWEHTGGILQADAEGFSNESGAHILWQFSDGVAGDYTMAVLQKGKWVAFTMQLDNVGQREAFLAGKLPASI